MNKVINKYFVLILLIIAIAFFLNKPSLNYFLFQDDFYNFNITRIHNVIDFLNFFKFRNDIIAYRPISLQTYFFLLQYFFNFNAFGFRIVSMGIFFVCFLLLFKVSTIFAKSRQVGLFTAALWILSSIHFMSLSQINYNMIGTFFYLTTTLLFLNCLKGNKWYYFFSVFSFLLAVGSFEFAVTWPLVIGLYCLIVLKKNAILTLKIFSPFIIITVIYLILRSIYIKPPPIIEYQIAFNQNSVKAFLWYFLWVFNIPEEFKKQVTTNLIFFNNTFLSEYWFLVSKAFIGAILVLLLGIFIPIYFIIKDKVIIDLKLVLFALIWFAVGISPVLLLPNHYFMMYLTMPSIGLYFLIAYLVYRSHKRFLFLLVLVIWLVTTKSTLDFYNINSYIVESQRIARKFVTEVRYKLPNLPDNSIVYYSLPDKRFRQALMDQESIHAIYANESISIYYNKEELLADFKTGLNRPVYIYLPK